MRLLQDPLCKSICSFVGQSFPKTFLGLILVLSTVPLVYGQEGVDRDQYKWRVAAFWWFSQPSGFVRGSTDEAAIDLHRDFGFGSYSTFTGTADWRFKRKHHLLFAASPFESSRSDTLRRTITFRGDTYDVGTRVAVDIRSFSFAPGYQWDFIRRNWGYVALATQINLLSTESSITGQVAVNDQTATRKSSGSVFAPLPVLGPRARWYPIPSSNRLALDGVGQGMYFFGYGDFYSAKGTVGVGLTHSLKLTAGYQLGTRLSIHGGSNQIGLRLTQKGPVAGLEGSW